MTLVPIWASRLMFCCSPSKWTDKETQTYDAKMTTNATNQHAQGSAQIMQRNRKQLNTDATLQSPHPLFSTCSHAKQ